MSIPARDRCVTCSDEAVEAVVVVAEGLEARVRAGDAEERVGIDLVPDAAPGDLLLCHAGIALERVEGVEGVAGGAQVARSHDVGASGAARGPRT